MLIILKLNYQNMVTSLSNHSLPIISLFWENKIFYYNILMIFNLKKVDYLILKLFFHNRILKYLFFQVIKRFFLDFLLESMIFLGFMHAIY